MNILMINKFLYPRGGSELVMFQQAHYLRERGFQVSFWGMSHPENIVEFAHPLRERDFDQASGVSKLGLFFSTIWSGEARKNIRDLLSEHTFDIAHIHNYHHQITTSILPDLHRHMPIVQTLHDYKPICPNYRLYRDRDGQPCRDCLPHNYYHAIRHRCHKGSLAKSLAVSLQCYVDFALKRDRLIDHYIAPSNFMRDLMIEAAIDPAKVSVLENSIGTHELSPDRESRHFFIYFGRLVPEKGVDIALRAFQSVPEPFRLIVVGDGPARTDLEQLRETLSCRDRIEFQPHVPQDRLFPLLEQAWASLHPSRWYENCPLSILEAQERGVPVIAARIGGIPELVSDDDGLLFNPADVSDLAEKMVRMGTDKKLRGKLAVGSRMRAERRSRPEQTGERLVALYGRVINAWRAARGHR